MLVTVTDFGSIWRTRIAGLDVRGNRRPAAYFNSTGVPVHGVIRQRSRIHGYIRFNATDGFDPHHPLRMVNSVFECEEPCVWQDQNKVLCKRRLRTPEPPDFLLVVARSWELGALEIGAESWRSENTFLISFSEQGDKQEAMLLMPARSSLCTTLGTYRLEPFVNWPWSGRLQLQY
jgi:hypothetical protein